MNILKVPSLNKVLHSKKFTLKAEQKRKAKELKQQRHLQWLGEHGYIVARIRYLWIVIEDRPCARCGGRIKRQLDHIVPRALGGPNTEANFQVLCKRCHKIKTREDMKIIRVWRKAKKALYQGVKYARQGKQGKAKGVDSPST